jgi:hypothetical protein
LKFKDGHFRNDFKLNNIYVFGGQSGYHSGKIALTDDKRTIIFIPKNEFVTGEKVSVKICELKNSNSHKIPVISFQFKIADQKVRFDSDNLFMNEFGLNILLTTPRKSINSKKEIFSRDSIPVDFPQLTSQVFNNPAPGKIFLCNFLLNDSNYASYLMIVDNHGIPLRFKKMSAPCFDFKPQLNTYYTYGENVIDGFRFYATDTSLNVIDSFTCGNGYTTDLHELRILSNGHALLMSYDPEIVDMSQIVSGGDPNAIVTGLVLQEIDNEKNVIWQWRSWDHYKITDATHENLTAALIDYVHGNAIEVTDDGNILLSCRHMDEITKINFENGSIIWRLGGKNNQFTFINDQIKFSHQHAIRVLPNGNFTLYDNGNFHNPPFSRAVEYKMDETAKTMTLVWEYRNTPSIYGPATGYVERLSDGNTLIGWGITHPTVSEVTAQGDKTLELTYPQNVYTYRAFKLEPGQIIKLPMVNEPTRYSLKQNYPNPFNPITKIEYELPKTSKVTLSIYDLIGRLVLVLVDRIQLEGRYSVDLDSKNLSSGVYFYTMESENFRETKKLVIVK